MFLLPITVPLDMAWLIFPVVRSGERVTIPHKIALNVIVPNAELLHVLVGLAPTKPDTNSPLN
ncbi:hypothetical protein C6382_05275 [Pseudomonas sp. BBP2017]|nr:hypothetical protein C6382_05275 [Pseudomonas sp. BBP2017]